MDATPQTDKLMTRVVELVTELVTDHGFTFSQDLVDDAVRMVVNTTPTMKLLAASDELESRPCRPSSVVWEELIDRATARVW